MHGEINLAEKHDSQFFICENVLQFHISNKDVMVQCKLTTPPTAQASTMSLHVDSLLGALL